MVTARPQPPTNGVRIRQADPRELTYRLHPPPSAPNPQANRDLGPWLPPVFYQEMNDCVANATATCLQALANLTGKPNARTEVSRLAIFSWGRMAEGTFPIDMGMYANSGLDAVIARNGDCREDLAPYHPDPAYVPSDAAVADCPNQDWVLAHAPFYPSDPGGLDGMIMTALDLYRPVMICIRWDPSFSNTGPDGWLPPPDYQGQGYHELVIYGRFTARDGTTAYSVRNSWGDWWGDAGNCYMPISYLPAVCTDSRVVFPERYPPLT